MQNGLSSIQEAHNSAFPPADTRRLSYETRRVFPVLKKARRRHAAVAAWYGRVVARSAEASSLRRHRSYWSTRY